MNHDVSINVRANEGELARWQWGSLVAGVIALIVCAAGAIAYDRTAFFRAYLAAHQFFLGLALGSMAVLLIYHLTGGGWGFLIRRILEAQVNTLPLLTILFVPLAFGVEDLYRWARPEDVAENGMLKYQQFYLNKEFFWIRAASYFVIWLASAFLLNRWSRAEARTGDLRITRRAERWSGFLLVLYGLTLHFSSFDWIQSLESTFHSTIFPPVVAVGGIYSAFALSVILFAHFTAKPLGEEAISPKALNDLGNLLFSFLIISAYLLWFQYMLIWIGNLPADIRWYVERTRGGWQWVTTAWVLIQYAIPFCLLLFRRVKRDPKALAATACLIVPMELVQVYYEVMPAFPGTSIASHWMDFIAPIAIGGLWFAVVLHQLKGISLLPENDYNRRYALDHRHPAPSHPASRESLGHA